MCRVIAPSLVRPPLVEKPVIPGKMLPNNPAPTLDAIFAILAPGIPNPVGHHEVEDTTKAVMFSAGDATRHMTSEVMNVGYSSAARNIGQVPICVH